MRRAVRILWLLAVLAGGEARADLVARSRNSVVFVESTRANEEWEAFRLVDAGHPAAYRVDGPGRVLLRVRTLSRPEPIDGVAAVLVDDQIVMTIRVSAEVDPQAKLTDGGGRPSGLKVYLVQVPEGRSRVTVRYSEGPAMLVAARFAPPLASAETGDAVPLVAPRTRGADVPRVGALERGGGTLAAGPVEPGVAERPIEPPLPDGDAGLETAPRTATVAAAPRQKSLLDDHPSQAPGLEMPMRPTGQGAFVLLEVRAGPQLDGFAGRPGLTAGLDLRGALFPGANPRRYSLGIAVDGVYTQTDEVVRLGGAPIDVARVRHVYGVLTADFRFRYFVVPDVVGLYASIGGGVQLGQATVRTGDRETTAGSSGFLGALRLGATLGSVGSRPFIEVRAGLGVLNSEVLRAGPDAMPGDAISWFTASALIGWRFEIGFDEDAAPRAASE